MTDVTDMTTSVMAVTRPEELRGQVIDRVERRIHRLLEEERDVWARVDRRAVSPVDAIGSLVEAGGKRLRPVFCATAFLALGGDPADESIIDVAAALELLHAFALLHDDIVDDSPMRRGAPTAHVRFADRHASLGWRGESRRFGEGMAVLAGDLAFAYANRLVSATPPAVRAIWSTLCTEMIVGQALDIGVAAEFVPDVRLARWIAVGKSGRYSIQRPLELGAALAGRTDLAPYFERYGVAAGEAFQLRDDLIDVFGESDVIGKPAGLDVDRCKVTTMIALAVSRDERIREYVENGDRWDADTLRTLLTESGVRAEVERTIDALVDEARQAIGSAPLDEMWRQELIDLAVRAAYRDR